MSKKVISTSKAPAAIGLILRQTSSMEFYIFLGKFLLIRNRKLSRWNRKRNTSGNEKSKSDFRRSRDVFF
jgi:hypothetical protein